MRLRLPLTLVLLLPTPCAAQPLTFDRAIALAADGPEVRAVEREGAARAAADDGIGGTVGATQITVMPGAVVAPQDAQGFEAQINATQSWNLGDLGGASGAAARAERSALDAEARAVALRGRLEAARRWVELWALQQVAERLEARRALTARRVERQERALALGASDAPALAEARAAEAAAAERMLALEGERVEAANALAIAIGEAADPPPRASGPLPRPRLPSLAACRARIASLEALPEVALQRALAAAADARIAEASAGFAPVLSVGAQLERSASDAYVVYGILGLTFDGFGMATRSTAQAEGEAARRAADGDTAAQRARVELEGAIHEVQHARRLARLLDERLRPALEARVAQRAAQVEAGELEVFALLDAEEQRIAAEEASVRAEGARAWAEVRLWLLLAELAR